MNLWERRDRIAHSHSETVREYLWRVFARSFGFWVELVALAWRSCLPRFLCALLLANFASTSGFWTPSILRSDPRNRFASSLSASTRSATVFLLGRQPSTAPSFA